MLKSKVITWAFSSYRGTPMPVSMGPVIASIECTAIAMASGVSMGIAPPHLSPYIPNTTASALAATAENMGKKISAIMPTDTI